MPQHVEIKILPSATVALANMSAEERVLFDQTAALLRNNPLIGRPFGNDPTGRRLYQVSVRHMHVIHAVHFRRWRDTIFIVRIEIAEWTPKHVDLGYDPFDFRENP
jgi:hypothetical protein